MILVFFALVLFGALGYTIYQQLAYMPELIQNKQQQVVEARADELSKELKGIENIVGIAANSPTVRSMDMEAIQEYLPHLITSDTIRNMTISDGEGNAWTTYDAFIDISDQEQFERIFVQDEFSVLSEPFESPYIEEDVPIMTIAQGVLNEEGETVGLVNAVVSMGFVDELLSTMKTAESCYTYIIDREGRIVSHPSKEVDIEDHISNWMPEEEHRHEILNHAKGSLEYTTPEGVSFLGVYTEIEARPGWKMVMSFPTEVAYAEYYAIIEYILGMLFFGIIVIMIFAYFYANTLSKPVLALKSVFESAAEGNLGVEAEEKYPNEFGKTGATFNVMLNQIKQLTFRDPATDLYNQNSFVVELRQKFKEKNPPGNHYLLLVSIDNFKRIDSIGGQGSGDQALKVIADRLKNFTEEGELIGRYYGDEMILYIKSRSTKVFHKRLEKLRNIYDYPIYLKGVQYRLKTSIGITAINHPTTELKEEIKEVTVAKQKVKRSGGNGYEFYNKRFKEEIVEEQQMEEALFYAIAKDELYLVYQPILSVADDRVIGHEALLRWEHPVYGRISVPRIIDLAEKSGLIMELGEWTLKEACRQNQEWLDRGFGPLIMAVNFSALQMADSNILETVKESLEESGMDPELLNIEITETVAMIHTDQKVELMTALKKIGVTFSIDDFGTGYSSLSYFTNFPVDTLKIDRSFIHNMLIDRNARTVTTTIIKMAQALNLRIIAEGVETQQHLEALKELECSHYQGYLAAKPDRAKRCEEIMKKHNRA